jgi:hypothetical protein
MSIGSEVPFGVRIKRECRANRQQSRCCNLYQYPVKTLPLLLKAMGRPAG